MLNKYDKILDKYREADIEKGTTSGQMAFWNGTTWTYTEITELFWDDTNKNLGIGTDSPESMFTIRQYEDSNALRFYGYDDHSENYGEMYINQNGNLYARASRGMQYVCDNFMAFQSTSNSVFFTSGSGSGDAIKFYGGGEYKVVLNGASGNLGIGTDEPQYPLHLYRSEGGGSAIAMFEQYNNLGIYFDFKNTENEWGIGIDSGGDFIIRDVTGGNINSVQVQAEAPLRSLHIRSTGFVGLGGTSDYRNKFEIYDSGGNTLMSVRDSNGLFMFGSGNFASERMQIDGNLFLDGDSDKVLLGAGKDLEVYYDGTDAVIDTGAVAASDLIVDCGTEKTVELAETVWEDLRTPLSAIKRLGFSDPDWVQFKDDGSGSAGVYALAFSKTKDEEVYFAVQIPHAWKQGSNIRPHVHWSPIDTDTGSVTWKLEYTIADIGGTFGNTATVDVTDAGNGIAYQHQLASLDEIDMSSYTDATDVSTMLICRLYRDVSDADDYDNDAILLEIDFHYEIDTLGSRTETTK